VSIAVTGCRFAGSFRGFVRNECCTVGHGSVLQTFYFAILRCRPKNKETGGWPISCETACPAIPEGMG
jgi:hypothetical protein